MRARLAGGALVAAAIGALGSQQLFREPSYELALAAGFLCPSVAAVVTALELCRAEAPQPLAMLARGVENGVLLSMIAYAVAFAWGLSGGFCDLTRGTLLFALGPGIGAVLGGVCGAAASEIARRRRKPGRWAVTLALAGPLGSIAFHLGWFYFTPTIFAYEPFVGYFSGALWDTTLIEGGLPRYRAASAATLFAVYVLALHLERDGARLRFRSLGRPGLALIGAGAALASLLSVAFGSALGHWQTAGTIADTLGGEVRGARCRVLYDARLARDHLARFTADCDAQVSSIEAWLGTPEAERIAGVDVFLFFDANQKRDLMGAGRTSVAKPWRREIYLQNTDYPHPVMRHELMHVLAGAHGRGPFDIAGYLGGWLPNPGLIEGIAEASAPRDDNLSGDQWAAAMRRLELLPRMEQLLSLSFFANHASTSYVAAGSFISHVRDSYGAEALRRWYGGASLREAAGVDIATAEQAWWQKLDAIAIDDAALAHAAARFDRPGLFARSCPHVVDEAMAEANARVNAGAVGEARAGYHRILALDPGNWHARMGLVACHARDGDRDAALAELRQLAADERLTRTVRARAEEDIGDQLLRAGHVAEARAHYATARRATTDEGRLRTIDVKDHYADDPVARAALVALLVGTTPAGPYHEEALDRIGQWRAERPDDGVPDYLFARQHLDHGRHDLAAASLDAARAKTIAVPRVAVEMARMRLVAACALGEDPTPYLTAYRDHPLASPSRVAWYADLAARCRTTPWGDVNR